MGAEGAGRGGARAGRGAPEVAPPRVRGVFGCLAPEAFTKLVQLCKGRIASQPPFFPVSTRLHALHPKHSQKKQNAGTLVPPERTQLPAGSVTAPVCPPQVGAAPRQIVNASMPPHCRTINTWLETHWDVAANISPMCSEAQVAAHLQLLQGQGQGRAYRTSTRAAGTSRRS